MLNQISIFWNPNGHPEKERIWFTFVNLPGNKRSSMSIYPWVFFGQVWYGNHSCFPFAGCKTRSCWISEEVGCKRLTFKAPILKPNKIAAWTWLNYVELVIIGFLYAGWVNFGLWHVDGWHLVRWRSLLWVAPNCWRAVLRTSCAAWPANWGRTAFRKIRRRQVEKLNQPGYDNSCSSKYCSSNDLKTCLVKIWGWEIVHWPSCSPPVRWGLLDLMWAVSLPIPDRTVAHGASTTSFRQNICQMKSVDRTPERCLKKVEILENWHFRGGRRGEVFRVFRFHQSYLFLRFLARKKFAEGMSDCVSETYMLYHT